ncbi:MAG: hypothetical protein RLZZ15_3465, partial [Verrucomicrobiota bacterium]
MWCKAAVPVGHAPKFAAAIAIVMSIGCAISRGMFS